MMQGVAIRIQLLHRMCGGMNDLVGREPILVFRSISVRSCLLVLLSFDTQFGRPPYSTRNEKTPDSTRYARFSLILFSLDAFDLC
jgi:hypothetical protein